MQFQLSEDEQSFRDQVTAALQEELPPGWEREAGRLEADFPFLQGLYRRLGRRGLMAPGWPREHGGMGLGHVKQAIYKEVMAYRRVPIGGYAVGVELVGPVLMLHAAQEQQRRHLPAIAAGEEIWAQCFTEPASGSDLGSLTTTAEPEGDWFVVNGKKVGSGEAKGARWATVLVRTDPDLPRYEGLSLLTVEIDRSGISIEPRTDLAGGTPFVHVTFERVRVPRTNLVGELNQGWALAQTTLDFERSNIGAVAAGRRLLDDLLGYCRSSTIRLPSQPVLRHRLASLRVELEAARWLAYRVVWLQAQGQRPSHEASISKLFGSELSQRLARAATEMLGAYGGLLPGSREARLDGLPALDYLASLAATIGAGTSEIQRNLIAIRGLGLPRG